MTENLNEYLESLKFFYDLGVTVRYKEESIDQVLSLLKLTDSSGVEITKSGYGVQFNLIIIFYILQKLMGILEAKSHEIFSDEKGTKAVSLIVCIDEPEIHMHPYMQRSLIKTIHKILTNQDSGFSEFLKNNFDIDTIIGQGIIVTHSPNILLNDYKQYVRLYNDNTQQVLSISGYEIALEDRLEKHLYKQIQYIKEAFFPDVLLLLKAIQNTERYLDGSKKVTLIWINSDFL